jgi:hypothetical protein
VPAPEIEALVLDGVRRHLAAIGEPEPPDPITDRDLIERYVESVTVKPEALGVHLVSTSDDSAPREGPNSDDPDAGSPATTVVLAWTAPSFAAVKGIVHAPAIKSAMKPESRDVLLAAIVKARTWIDDLRLGRIASFAEIAKREDQCERHIRLLAPLAFVSPRIIAAIRQRASRPHGHRPRQGAAVFVGRAGAEHRVPTIVAFKTATFAPILRSTPEGGLSNRSLSTIEPVSGMRKRKLESGEQRLAPQSRLSRTEILEIAEQRLRRARLTRGNIGGSHTLGNRVAEIGLTGWGARIRT